MTSEHWGSPEASCWGQGCAAQGTAGTCGDCGVCPERGVLTCDAAPASLARCQKVPCPPTLHSDRLLRPWGAAMAHLSPAGRTCKSFPVSLSLSTLAGGVSSSLPALPPPACKAVNLALGCIQGCDRREAAPGVQTDQQTSWVGPLLLSLEMWHGVGWGA